MYFSVLGAGELGLACSLALTAGVNPAQVTIVNRDGLLRKCHEPLLKTSGPHHFESAATAASVLPSIQVQAYQRLAELRCGDQASSRLSHRDGVCVCSPVTALFEHASSAASASVKKKEGQEKDSARSEAPPQSDPPLLDYLSHINVGQSGAAAAPFVACFTRGFEPDGKAASELVERALTRGVPEASGLQVPVYTVTGPIIAKEWLHESTLVRNHNATSVSKEAEGLPVHDVTDAVKPFSGTALSFGLQQSHPSIADDGFHDAMEQLFCKVVFPRESVLYERDATAGAALSIVNGCLPLCAFGAGLVANAYAGSSVSALAAYAQHCATATTTLVNDLVDGRTRGAPLPMGAYAAIFSACNVFSSKEFILGRQLDFKFRQMDAMQSVYPGRTHEAFSATVDGLHTRMQAKQVPSPFYELLMDTFGTVIRASTAAKVLVKQEGVRDCRDGAASPFLAHAMAIDEAMLSGDEERFEAAKRRLAEEFSFYPVKQ